MESNFIQNVRNGTTTSMEENNVKYLLQFQSFKTVVDDTFWLEIVKLFSKQQFSSRIIVNTTICKFCFCLKLF